MEDDDFDEWMRLQEENARKVATRNAGAAGRPAPSRPMEVPPSWQDPAPSRPAEVPTGRVEPRDPQEVPRSLQGAAMARDALPQDRRKLWSTPIKHITSPIFKALGSFLRPVRVASVCSGFVPEKDVFEEFDVPFFNEFTCDNDEHVCNAVQDNGRCGQHHFIDLRSFVDNQGCPCAQHDFDICKLLLAKFFLDFFLAGISCRPYSLARSDSRGNWWQHGDFWMAEAFICMLLNYEPAFAILENVIGFVLSSKWLVAGRRASISGLVAFLQRLKDTGVLDIYTIRVHILCTPFLKQVRRRVYIGFYHRRAGGRRAARRASRILEANAC